MPDSIVAGDFNGDGQLDLAVANSNSNDISVLLGDGDGTFQPQVIYATGDGPSSLVAGDFNGDGRPTSPSPTRSPMTSPCCWATATAPSSRNNGSPRATARASWSRRDFNGDGRLDLAVANAYSDNISVLLGNGDGTFYGQAADQIPVGILSEFFGGGRLQRRRPARPGDRRRLTNEVSVLLGNGDGTFQDQGEFAVGDDPDVRWWRATSTATVGLDLAVANEGNGTVSILMGNGDGTFQPQVTYAVGDEP